MYLPCVECGNKHALVMLTVFSVQEYRLVKLLCEDIVPMFRVPEALMEPCKMCVKH